MTSKFPKQSRTRTDQGQIKIHSSISAIIKTSQTVYFSAVDSSSVDISNGYDLHSHIIKCAFWRDELWNCGQFEIGSRPFARDVSSAPRCSSNLLYSHVKNHLSRGCYPVQRAPAFRRTNAIPCRERTKWVLVVEHENSIVNYGSYGSISQI